MSNFDISGFLNNNNSNSRTRSENQQYGNGFETFDYNEPVEYNGIRILSIMLTETGTYNPEYLRPWAISVDRDTVEEVAEIASESTGNISRANLAGVAGKMLRYRSEVTQRDLVDIENSWDSTRLAVIIELEETQRSMTGNQDEVTYITGFTDRLDISQNDIAPDTRIYVSNIFRVKRNTRILTSSQQLISPNYHNNGKFFKGSVPLYVVRPRDCFNSELAAADTRGYNAINSANSLTGTSIRSSRTNNLSPTTYMASAINAISHGMNSNSLVDGYGNNLSGVGNQNYTNDSAMYQAAAAALMEETATETNSFLYMLRRESNTFMSESVFEWADITNLFGRDIYRVTQHNRRKQVRNNGSNSRWSQAGDCAAWNNTEDYGYNAVIATAFKQAIPAYAIESLIYSCRVELTNYQGGDTFDEFNYGGFMVTVSNVIFVAKMPDVRTENMLIERFKQNITQYIARDVSLNGDLAFDLVAEIDWRFDSFYSVSVDGNEPIDYSTAAFSASLTSPVLTFDNEFASNLVSDVHNIATTVNNRRY